jgi:outer membrane protein assembly factor BamA
MSLIFAANGIAVASEITRANNVLSKPRIDFFVDGQRWLPSADIERALSEINVTDLPNSLIHFLFERNGLQNIVVYQNDHDKSIGFEVHAIRSPKVGEIGFRGLTAAQSQQIRPILKTRVGLPFIADESERDREIIRKKLAERGYFSAKVGAIESGVGVSGELKIVFPVDLQTPCRIAEVKIFPDEGVFDYFTTPIELGSLCDRSAIEETLERQRVRLMGDAYLANELSLLSLDVAPDQQRASAHIKYIRGPRTRIEVVNRQSGVVTDLLGEFRERLSAYDVLSFSDDELRADVRKLFVSRGFASASVTGPSRLTDPNGDSVIRFFVQTGPLVVISDVQFMGDLPFSRRDVLERLELAPSIFGGAIPFVEDALPRFRERLLNQFIDEGYSEASVSEPTVFYASDGRSVTVVFESKSGFRSVLRDVTILGRPFDFNVSTAFQDRILQPGQPLNAQKIRNIEEELRLELMNGGYAYARIQAKTKSLSPTGQIKPIQVILDLDSGPLVKIGRVYAEGDSFGKQERIISESGLQSGDVFTPERLEQSRLRILKHDLFDTVIIEPLSTEAVERRDGVLDVVIRLSAKKSYSLGLSPGYGTRSGYRFNIDFAKNNLTSDGLRLTSTVTLSQEKLQSSVFSNQRIMGRKLTLGLMEALFRAGDIVTPLDVSLLSGVEVSAQSLSDRYYETFEGAAFWRPLFLSRLWTLQARLIHEWSKAFGEDVKPLEALERPTVKIREIALGLSLDTRDSIEWPTRGFIFDVNSNHARFGLQSDVSYDRYSFDSSIFFPVSGRFSGAFNLGAVKVSDVVNAQAEAVTAPSSRRATLAGRALVRGFPEASSAITPGPLLWLNFVRPEGNPLLVCQPTLKAIGASNVLYAKSELRFRSPFFSESLGFAGFVDSGAAFFTAGELQTLQNRLKGGESGLDPGGIDQCALKSASVIGDGAVDSFDSKFLQKYFKNSYISTGLGLRYIISNFASVNVDVGFPLREPLDAARNEQCVSPTQVGNTVTAPVCVKRSTKARLFGLFPVPGAYHLGIGANF